MCTLYIYMIAVDGSVYLLYQLAREEYTYIPSVYIVCADKKCLVKRDVKDLCVRSLFILNTE